MTQIKLNTFIAVRDSASHLDVDSKHGVGRFVGKADGRSMDVGRSFMSMRDSVDGEHVVQARLSEMPPVVRQSQGEKQQEALQRPGAVLKKIATDNELSAGEVFMGALLMTSAMAQPMPWMPNMPSIGRGLSKGALKNVGSAALRLTPTMFGWPLIALGISAFAFPKKMGDGSMRPQPYPTARDAFLGYVPLSEPGLSDAGRGGYLVNDVDAALPIGRTPPPKFPILEEVPATDQELSIHEGGLPVDVPTLEGRPMTPQSFGDTVYLSEANKADANRNGNDHSRFIVNRTYYLGPDHRGEMVTYAAPHALMENELVRVSKSEFMLHRFGNEVTKPDGAYVFASVPNRTEVRFAQSEGAIAPSQLVRPTNDTYEGDLRRVAFPISIGRLPPLLGQMVFDNGTLVKRDVLGGTFKEVNRKVVNGVPQYENVYPGDFPALVSHGPLWALVRLGQEEYGLKRIKDHSGRLVEGVVIDPPVGKYSAVQLSNGVIQVSSKNHLTAAQDDVPVQYAMTLYFSEQSYLDGWTNESGHFRPKIHDGKFVDLPRFRGSNQALDAVYGPIKGWYTKIDPVIFK